MLVGVIVAVLELGVALCVTVNVAVSVPQANVTEPVRLYAPVLALTVILTLCSLEPEIWDNEIQLSFVDAIHEPLL